jgi:transposase
MRSHRYLGAYLRRQRARLGAPKAITATAHKLARILYNLLRHGIEYMRQEEAAYAEQVRERLEKQLRRRAKELGYALQLIVETVTMPDGEVLTVTPDGEIVNG